MAALIAPSLSMKRAGSTIPILAAVLLGSDTPVGNMSLLLDHSHFKSALKVVKLVLNHFGIIASSHR